MKKFGAENKNGLNLNVVRHKELKLLKRTVFTKDVLNYTVLMQKILNVALFITNIVEDIKKGVAIAKIAKDYNVTRQTVYRIKKTAWSMTNS